MSSLDPVGDAQRMRASDADRERVAELLREAYVEGRLSPVEHEERLAGVYGRRRTASWRRSSPTSRPSWHAGGAAAGTGGPDGRPRR